MSKYKIYIYLGILIAFVALVVGLIISNNRANSYKDLYNKELQNVEAYRNDNTQLKDEAIQYKMTIDDLYYSKDSLDKKILEVMNELKIKDNKVKELQYQLTQANRTDTVKLTDTIFKENVSIDTTFGDEWYNMHLQLQYPSTVITSPTFNIEEYVYTYTQTNYVGGKSKCFFINWFKKKYTTTEVKTEIKNPYIGIVKQKFIEINK